MPATSVTHDWGPASVPLPCEVAVWALRGGGHETAVLVGYEEIEPEGTERALTVPWGHVEHQDGTVVDAARRVLYERAGVLAGPDDTFRVAYFDCEQDGTLNTGAAARVIMALHLDDLTEVIAAPTGSTRLERLSVRGVGDLADWEGQGQRMGWGSALAMQHLGEGVRSHDRARELLQ